MTWNYRIVVEPNHDGEFWSIREVYYDEAGEPVTWTVTDIGVQGESLEQLAKDLEYHQEALNLPALKVVEGSRLSLYDGRL